MWKPPEWVKHAVFYQIFPDRFYNGDPTNDPPGVRPWGELPHGRSFFGGDLQGILDKLDYLAELGITALYLTPIFKASTNHRYDGEDYFLVDPVLGGNGLLRRLVDALHARGIRVVLDGVFNHCGRGHPFFQDVVRRGRSSPYWGWFIIDGDRPKVNPEPNYACWAGHPALPEWNHKNPEVREYLLSAVRHWLRDYEIDGWRLDTVEYLPPDFVKQIYETTKAVNPEAYVLGEVMGLATSWFRHEALDGVMHYRLWEGLVHFLAQGAWSADRFVRYVHYIWKSYPLEANYACYNLLGSHDKPRFLTLSGGDAKRVELAAAFLFAFPGAPALYYGDEVGLEGGEDPDCRRCFPWAGSWNEALLTKFRELTALRKGEVALRAGELVQLRAEGSGVTLVRRHGSEQILFALNPSPHSLEVPLPAPGVDLVTGATFRGSICLPPHAFCFIKARP